MFSGKKYCSNFRANVGLRLKRIQVDLAIEECKRPAREEASLSSSLEKLL
jgi:hypothetical protein